MKDAKGTAKEGSPLGLDELEDWEWLMLVHCVEAVSLKELKTWVKAIAKDKVQAEELRRGQGALGEQRQAAEETGASTGEPLSQIPGASRDAATLVQPAVKQGYGASILSYISLWGGSTPQSAQNAAEQQRAVEAAVEAVTLAEAEKEPPTQTEAGSNSDGDEPAEDEFKDASEHIAGLSESTVASKAGGAGTAQPEEPVATTRGLSTPSPVSSARAEPPGARELSQEPERAGEAGSPAAGENTYRFQLRCLLGQASIEIENICPQ